MKKTAMIIMVMFLAYNLLAVQPFWYFGTKGYHEAVSVLPDKNNLQVPANFPDDAGSETWNIFVPAGDDNHVIGEEYLDGIIFHIYTGSDGKRHGLIVSKVEATLQWQSKASLVKANKKNLGAYNTKLMVNSPARDWAESLGPDWYLPSIDELGALYKNANQVNKTSKAKGYPVLAPTFYWSSTEYDAYNASNLDFQDGTGYYYVKTKAYKVRAIRAF